MVAEAQTMICTSTVFPEVAAKNASFPKHSEAMPRSTNNRYRRPSDAMILRERTADVC